MDIMKMRKCISTSKNLEEKTAKQIELFHQLRRSIWHKCREWLDDNPDADPALRHEALDLIVLGLEDLAREKYGINDLSKYSYQIRANPEARVLHGDWRAYRRQRDVTARQLWGKLRDLLHD